MPVALPTITPDYEAQPKAPYKVVDALTRLQTFANTIEGKVNGLHTLVTIPALAPALTAAQIAQIQKALQATGSAPLVVSGLPGAGGVGLLVGTHSQRLMTSPTLDATFYETDRHALYGVINGSWVLVGSAPEMECTGVGALPVDLGPNDAAFYAFDTTAGLLYLWDGAVWHWHKGIQYGLFANRPVAFTGCDAGVIYVATDLNDTAWQLSYATGTWVLLINWGGPAAGALSAITTGLGVNDAGFSYYAQDFDRTYVWTGGGWVDGRGQPTRGMIAAFAGAPTGNGWQLCDGSTVTGSTSTGGTGSVTVPNLIGQFVRMNNSSGGTGSAVSISYQTGGTVINDVNYTNELPYTRL